MKKYYGKGSSGTMETNRVRVQADRDAGLSPAFFRRISMALAARDSERTWLLIDRAGVNEPLLVARALAARDKLSFLGHLLKVLPVAQQAELHEVIASLTEGRQPPIAPAKSVPQTAASAWQSEDEQAFLTAVAATQANVSSILIAATDVGAQQSYPLLFQRELTLLSLQFDHTAEASATSALHLRRTGKSTVARPEWVRGDVDPDECPVLYAADFHRATSVFIKAKISTILKLPTELIEVRALEGGVLGAIDPFVVDFTQGLEVSLEVPLTHLGLHGPSQTDVSWRWEYRVGKGAWHFLARTHHRVYCTPRRPNAPWILSEHDVANPWTAALDIACQANLSGSEDMDGLAASLCEVLNPGGLAPNPFRLAYSINDTGDASYNGPNGTLNLSAFLERAGGGVGNGERVNCDDCAGLVVTLANLLGCDLYEQYISTSAMHPVIPIGEGQWWANFLGFQPSFGATGDGILTYHSVAWRGNNANDAVVFDITWLLNAFGNPDDPEQPHPALRSPWYPYGERFKVAGALDYIGRLHPALGWSLGAKTRRGIS
jgi:hypothetical protein